MLDLLLDKPLLLLCSQCTFLSKTIVAEDAGARAVIISDHKESDEFFTEMLDDLSGRKANIPATFLLGKNG